MSLARKSIHRALAAFLFSLAFAIFSLTLLVVGPIFQNDSVMAQEGSGELDGLSEEERQEILSAIEKPRPKLKPRPKPQSLPPKRPASAPPIASPTLQGPNAQPLGQVPMANTPTGMPPITAIPVPATPPTNVPEPIAPGVPSPMATTRPIPPTVPMVPGTSVPAIPTPLMPPPQPEIPTPTPLITATQPVSPTLANAAPSGGPPTFPDQTGPIQIGALSSGKVQIERVRFTFATLDMTPRSQQVLQTLAQRINADPMIQSVRIEAHTDSVGSDAANLYIAQQRAKAVKAFLVAQGVDSYKLQEVGKGDKEPLVSNATYEGQETNRRIEFYVTK